jgi:hypothetical protein
MTQKHEIPRPKDPKHAPPKGKAPKPYVPPRPPIRSQPASPAPTRRGR